MGGAPPYVLRGHADQELALLAVLGGGGEHGAGSLNWIDATGAMRGRADLPSAAVAVGLWTVGANKPGYAAAVLASGDLWSAAYPQPAWSDGVVGVVDADSVVVYTPGPAGLLYVARGGRVDVRRRSDLERVRGVGTAGGQPARGPVVDLHELEIRDLAVVQGEHGVSILLLLAPPQGAEGQAWILWVQ